MKNTKINYVIFGVNFLFSLTCLFGYILCILLPFFGKGSFFSLLGALVFFPLPIVLLIMEWKGTIHEKYKHLKKLGIISILFAAFIAFGFITNAYEAFQDWNENSEKFLLRFGPICAVLIAYCTFAGIYRIKFYKKIEKSNLFNNPV